MRRRRKSLQPPACPQLLLLAVAAAAAEAEAAVEEEAAAEVEEEAGPSMGRESTRDREAVSEKVGLSRHVAGTGTRLRPLCLSGLQPLASQLGVSHTPEPGAFPWCQAGKPDRTRRYHG